ncbi:MAG: AAA family ATPase [Candidatus Thermoplasmatota archaeon]
MYKFCFEDFRLINLKSEQLSALIKEIHSLFEEEDKKIYLFFDEIQNMENWQSWLRTLHNSRRYYLFISGSSSKLLAKEIATQLRGRYLNKIIFPFSFKEFLKYKNIEIREEFSKIREGEILRLLREYLTYGGFPEAVIKKEEKDKVEILKNYYDMIFYREILERFKIRNLALMEAFDRYVIQNFSNNLSLSKVEKYFESLNFKVSKKNFIKLFKISKRGFICFFI